MISSRRWSVSMNAGAHVSTRKGCPASHRCDYGHPSNTWWPASPVWPVQALTNGKNHLAIGHSCRRYRFEINLVLIFL